MSPLFLLTLKNLRLLVRSKGSALIVVFAPLLIILLLGLSFNNSAQYGLNIGVYAPSFTEDANSFVNTLQEQEFKIIKYDDSNSCISDVKSGYVHTCIALPESFAIDSNSPREITFYIDPSKINLVWMVQRTLEEKLNLRAQEITENLAQDMLSRIDSAKTGISTNKDQLSTVKEKEGSTASTASSLKDSLTGMDLTPPTSAYNVSVLTEFKTQLSAELTASSSKVSAAKSAINGANLSGSERSQINSLLTAASTSLSNATASLNAESGNSSFGNVAALVNNLQTDLNSAKTKLSDASAKVASASNNADLIQSALAQSVSDLEKIQSSLDAINAELAGQKVTDAKVVSAPLITKIETVSKENTYLNYMFPSLIILVIMFSSLLLGTTLVMMEKHSPAFTRNFFLPINKVTFILSTYLTTLILILVQVAIFLGISLVFVEGLLPSILPMALILFLAASIFTFLGMAIGYLFTSEETGALASISLGSLLLFVSGVILPLESVSPTLRSITYFNPFVIAEKLIREIFLFGSSLEALWMDTLLLFTYVAVLFLLILVLESLMHRHIFNNLFHHHHAQRHKDKINK